MPRPALPPETYDDGITVAEAARILGVDATTVRRMVENQDLEGWRVGLAKRAVRVSLASCIDYRESNSAADPSRSRAPRAPKPRPARARASFLEACAYLRSRGVRV